MSFHLVKGIDASTPPSSLPSWARFICGYIGGDTPHVWSEKEWQSFGKTPKLPIWVRSNPANANALVDAFDALRMLYHLRVPKGSVVALDLETAVDVHYVNVFFGVMRWAGYRLFVYGSTSTLFSNPVCNGYWPAKYTNNPSHLYPHSGVQMTQYVSGPAYDCDIAKRWQVLMWFWK